MTIDIVKDCINELLPAITCMVNQLLNEGHLPDTWKEALVRPKLKKNELRARQKELPSLQQSKFLYPKLLKKL